MNKANCKQKDKTIAPLRPKGVSEQLWDRYLIYFSCADDGKGNDVTTGRKLKTFDEWFKN